MDSNQLMILREATPADIPVIACIHVDTWRSTHQGIVPDAHLAKLSYERRANSWEQIFEHSAQNGDFTDLAEAGEVIGFANGGFERTHDPIYKGELKAIYILKRYQGQGVGRKLVQAVAKRLAETEVYSMRVWVLAENPACQFYAALGGQKISEQQIEIGGISLLEFAYGWTDTACLR